MKRLGELLTILFLLIACSHSQSDSSPATASSVKLCQIVSKPNEYVGRLVAVKVRVRTYRHGTSISDSSCPQKALQVIADEPMAKNDDVLGFYQFLAKHRNSTVPIYAKLTGRMVRGVDRGFVLKREFVFKLESVSEFSEEANR